MKKISLKELKEELSEWTELAHGGEIVEVTRYNKPFVIISSAKDQHGLRFGSSIGKKSLSKVNNIKNKGDLDLLHFLDEDRSEK